MKLRYKIALVLAVLGITFGLGRCKRTETSGPKLSVPPALPDDDNEQIIVDPPNHTITIRKPGGVKKIILPDVPTTIDIKKDGSVVVTAPQYGIERRPFIGAGYSDALRVAIGMDGLYWKRLDLGIGLAPTYNMHDARLFVSVSYTLKDNLRATIAIDHKTTVGAFLTLRI